MLPCRLVCDDKTLEGASTTSSVKFCCAGTAAMHRSSRRPTTTCDSSLPGSKCQVSHGPLTDSRAPRFILPPQWCCCIHRFLFQGFDCVPHICLFAAAQKSDLTSALLHNVYMNIQSRRSSNISSKTIYEHTFRNLYTFTFWQFLIFGSQHSNH